MWHPIETAPHGVRLIVWGSYTFDREPVVGAFTAWVQMSESGLPTRVYLDPSPHDDEYPTVEIYGVAKWQPLPEPPA